MQQRIRRLSIPVTLATVTLVVCTFNGAGPGTAMLGAKADAARSQRTPDPTVPVPLEPPGGAPAGLVTPATPQPKPKVATGTRTSAKTTGTTTSTTRATTTTSTTTTSTWILPLDPSNIPYIVLTPAGPALPPAAVGPAVPEFNLIPVEAPTEPPRTTSATSRPTTPPTIPPTTPPTTRPPRTTTTKPPAKAVKATAPTVPVPLLPASGPFAPDVQTIELLPPGSGTRSSPAVSADGLVVILTDTSNGTSSAGSLIPPTPVSGPANGATPVAVTPPTTAPAVAVTPLPSPVVVTVTTRPSNATPLPTVLITPVLDRSSPTAATADQPVGASNSGQTAKTSQAPTTTTPQVYVFTGRSDSDFVPPVSPRAAEVVAWALTQVGQPYVWGGEGVGGYDCSGLSMMAWRTVGVRITHQSRSQFAETARLNLTDLQPGDLVFYGDPIHHLGIYIGDNKMVEAAREGIPVRVSSIKRRDLIGAGRVRY